ncbi:hypothetical protein [Streptomyces mirabilis]|uniref:hypothetical protein n=1 Tax=Streptomyces mirabilis TaxID=68239 RepID=UPI00332C99E5
MSSKREKRNTMFAYEAEDRRLKALYAAIFKAWDAEGVVLHEAIEEAGLTRTYR